MSDQPVQTIEFDSDVDSIIKMAVLAVGGQGGGVLSNWIISLAERNDYFVQSTSIAGVAQRTGATVYYLEMLPKAALAKRGTSPIFSLSPSSGDVDIVLAAELMEAGRAIMRGFVTPDRTTLITSTHRAFATSEKSVPGNGVANADAVLETARQASVDLIAFDMEIIAQEAGSVISASMFGSLAGSGKLPFAPETYEETIRASGRGVDASLRAFRAACEAAKDPDTLKKQMEQEEDVSSSPKVPDALKQEWDKLQKRVDAMPDSVRDLAQAGLKKTVDFQDLDYGSEYLDRLEQFLAGDKDSYELSQAAAKYIANAMAYDDLIRVADLKTRENRFNRIRKHHSVEEDNGLMITEYFHPGAKEICSLMPTSMAKFIENRKSLYKGLDWMVNRGRRVRTDTIFWFSILYVTGGLRRFRRGLYRHKIELAHLEAHLKSVKDAQKANYDLAVEIMKCQRLIKGYSDTHLRGLSKYSRVIDTIQLVADRDDAADWARRLRDAALMDVDGIKLDDTTKTIRSFAVN